MSPSGLSWTQGFLFFFLGVSAPGVWHCVRKFRTKHGTSGVELISIHVENDTNPFQGEQPAYDVYSSGAGDVEAGRSPANIHAPLTFHGFSSRPDRQRQLRPNRKRQLRLNCRTPKAPASTKKRPFEPETTEALNFAELANIRVSTTPVPRPPRRHFVPRPSLTLGDEGVQDEVSLVEVKTFEGLRHRPNSTSQGDDRFIPEAVKRFRGVRYRHNREKWAAEIRPAKSRNKIWLGSFQSQEQAALAVDVAYHYYGMKDKLNFPDTPGILATRPIPAGLDEKEKAMFVKNEAMRLATMAS